MDVRTPRHASTGQCSNTDGYHRNSPRSRDWIHQRRCAVDRLLREDLHHAVVSHRSVSHRDDHETTPRRVSSKVILDQNAPRQCRFHRCDPPVYLLSVLHSSMPKIHRRHLSIHLTSMLGDGHRLARLRLLYQSSECRQSNALVATVDRPRSSQLPSLLDSHDDYPRASLQSLVDDALSNQCAVQCVRIAERADPVRFHRGGRSC